LFLNRQTQSRVPSSSTARPPTAIPTTTGVESPEELDCGGEVEEAVAGGGVALVPPLGVGVAGAVGVEEEDPGTGVPGGAGDGVAGGVVEGVAEGVGVDGVGGAGGEEEEVLDGGGAAAGGAGGGGVAAVPLAGGEVDGGGDDDDIAAACHWRACVLPFPSLQRTSSSSRVQSRSSVLCFFGWWWWELGRGIGDGNGRPTTPRG
jgi:hypothetical protein